MAPLDLTDAAVELAFLKMCLRSLLTRAAADDAFVSGLRVEWDRGDCPAVELLDVNGHPIGGFTL